jgi:hypothetical protein
MPKNESEKPDFDWAVTTFEGSRREQLRRWAQLPLENILLAIEEMQELANQLGARPSGDPGGPPGVKEGHAVKKKQSMWVAERPARYGSKRRRTRKK